MKDWIKYLVSIVAAIIMGLIGFAVHLSLDSVRRDIDSVRRDIDRIETSCEDFKDEHKTDIVIIHKRITEECKP